MSGLAIAAVVVTGVWLGVLTVSLVLVIRQLALVTARFDRANLDIAMGSSDEGPPIGVALPEVVINEIPELVPGPAHLLLLAATCGPCRRMAEELHGEQLPSESRMVALVPGRRHLADGVIDVLPPAVIAVRDPAATEAANLLQIERVPFALALRDGVVVAKSPVLFSADDLVRFLRSTSSSPNGHGASSAKEGVSHVGER